MRGHEPKTDLFLYQLYKDLLIKNWDGQIFRLHREMQPYTNRKNVLDNFFTQPNASFVRKILDAIQVLFN